MIADEEGVGYLVDLRSSRSAGAIASRSLPEVVDGIAARHGRPPAVLDCTGGTAEHHLGSKVFTPPAPVHCPTAMTRSISSSPRLSRPRPTGLESPNRGESRGWP